MPLRATVARLHCAALAGGCQRGYIVYIPPLIVTNPTAASQHARAANAWYPMSPQVLSIHPEPAGQLLASGGTDGVLRVWHVPTCKCLHTWALGDKITCVRWCPASHLSILAAAAGSRVVLLPLPLGPPALVESSREAMHAALGAAEQSDLVTWVRWGACGIHVRIRIHGRHFRWATQPRWQYLCGIDGVGGEGRGWNVAGGWIWVCPCHVRHGALPP